MPSAVSHRSRLPITGDSRSLAARLRTPIMLLSLAALTVLAFAPVFTAGFVNFDDDQYLTANTIVRRGLTLAGIRWAFTHSFLDLYHPLSLISLMADVNVFGLNPIGFHAENLLIHIASVWLVFLIFRRATGNFWRSGLLAAVFAIHPLRVESVAWVAERKDVLAMFFGLLAIYAYLWFVIRPSVVRYVPIVACLLLSLLAKPMFATLPAVLLLFDFWPLGRFRRETEADQAAGETRRGEIDRWRRIGTLLLEKLPLFVLVGAFYLLMRQFKPTLRETHLDYVVQTTGARWANAAVSYPRYLLAEILPFDLATPYPLVPHWPAWIVGCSIALLTAAAIGVAMQARRRPWLLFGWLWFLGTLVPEIGVVGQIAFQSMADRYSYLPSIGLLAMIVWSIPEPTALERSKGRAPMWNPGSAIAVASVALAVLLVLTFVQASYWHDSIALFTHAAAVTSPNDFAEYSLGNAYFAEAGDIDDAVVHYRAAIGMKPGLASARDNLGYVLIRKGDYGGAIEQFRAALAIDPASAEAHDNWGTALAAEGDQAGAADQFTSAIKINPDYRDARLNLAVALVSLGQWSDAENQARQILAVNPQDADAMFVLATAERRNHDIHGRR